MFKFDRFGRRLNPAVQTATNMTAVHENQLSLPTSELLFDSDTKNTEFHKVFYEDDFLLNSSFNPIEEEENREIEKQIQLASRTVAENITPSES